MADVIRPANGQAAIAQSSGKAWKAPHGTAGYDAAIRERTLVAPPSGETRAWPKRPGPGAAHPAGWFRPADGEEAPPFRPGTGPARAHAHSHPPAGWFRPADGEEAPPFRPGTEPARSDAKASPVGVADGDRGGWHPNPQPASADPVRALWPWVFPQGWRPVPVVGPTEALRDRAGGPKTAPPPAVP